MVALLPSTAAPAYIPDSSELAVAGLQRATFVVGVRSGRRVGIDGDEPAPTVWVSPGVPASTAKTSPAPRVLVVKTRRRVPCVAARTRMLTSPRQRSHGPVVRP
jgi:hypothetical protein